MTGKKPRREGWRSRTDRGVALVEFALAVPLLAILVFGTVDFGRAYIEWNRVKNVAREGAAFAQLHPTYQADTSTDGGLCDAGNNTVDHAREEVGGSTAYAVTLQPALVPACQPFTTSSDPTVQPGRVISVRATKQFTVLVPLVGRIVGNPTLGATAKVKIQG